MSRNADNQLVLGVALVSIAALSLLFWLVYGRDPGGNSAHLSFLPAVNAACNSITTVFLLLGIYHVRHRRLEAHERCMKSAFLSSVLFLIGYLTYHFVHGDTRFLGQGWIRPVYFTLLISHILLSMIALPMVLLTLGLAWKKNFANHAKLARWTFPIWLYVSLTGVLIFFLLKHFQPA